MSSIRSTTLSDGLWLLSASKSLRVALVFFFNSLLRKLGRKERIRRFRKTRFKRGGISYFADSWDGLLVLRPSHETAVHAAISNVALESAGSGLFLNVGAHVGRYCLEFASCFEKTYAFEPTPATFALLEAGARLHPKASCVVPWQCCVGETDGTATLRLLPDESQNSVTVRSKSDSSLVEVRMVSLDSVLPREDWAKVKLVLVDAEGSETRVLLGARGVLAASQPVIILELLDSDCHSRCESILRSLGFSGRALDGANWFYSRESG
jgi:FkbM family methyltransferase